MLLISVSFHKATHTVEAEVGYEERSAIKDEDYPGFGLHTLLWFLPLNLLFQ